MANERDFMVNLGITLIDADIQKAVVAIKQTIAKIPKAATVKVAAEGVEPVVQNLSRISKTAKEASVKLINVADDFRKVQAAANEATIRNSIDDIDFKNVHAHLNEVGTAFHTKMRGIEKDALEAEAIANRAMNNIFSATSMGARAIDAAHSKVAQQAMQGGGQSYQEGQSAQRARFQGQITAFNANKAVLEKGILQGEKEVWNRHGNSVTKGLESFKALNNELPLAMKNMYALSDSFIHTALTFAEWSIAAKGIEAITGSMGKGFAEAVHSEKEQNIVTQTGLASGNGYSAADSKKVFQESINQARLMGEEVTVVQEGMGLWRKVAGNTDVAIGLNAMAMKLNAVSGAEMEETYRKSIATLDQMGLGLGHLGDLFNISTALALRFGGAIQGTGGNAANAVRQINDGTASMAAVMRQALGGGVEAMAKIAAIAAVTNRATGKDGNEVAGKLAEGFAAIEGPGIHGKLLAIGIETRNNINLVEQLHAAGAKAIQILEGPGGVKKQDIEFIKSLIIKADQLKPAQDIGLKGIKDQALDKLFTSMMGTTDLQLKEVRAGFEAIAIELQMEFLPQVKNVLGVMDNWLIPSMLANKSAIASVGQQVALLGLGFLAFNAITGTVATGVRMVDAFKTAFSNLVGVQNVALASMKVELSSYQRTLLQTLTAEGESSVEMEQSVRMLAAKHNYSIDSMILKLRELSIEKNRMTGALVADDLVIEDSMNMLAVQSGISLGQLEAGFASVAVASESFAVRASKAFLRFIPVIGMVVGAAFVAADAFNFVSDKAHKSYIHNIIADPEAQKNAIANEKKMASDLEAENKSGFHTTKTSYRNQGGEETFLRSKLTPQDKLDNLEKIAKHKAEQQALLTGKTAEEEEAEATALTHDQLIKRIKAQEAAAAKFAGKIKSESEKPAPDDSKVKGQKGQGSPGAVEALAIKDIATKYTELTAAIKEKIIATEESIKIDEKQIALYGIDSGLLKGLQVDIAKKQMLEMDGARNEASHQSRMQSELNNVQAKMSVEAAKPNGKTSTRYLGLAKESDTLKESIAKSKVIYAEFWKDILALSEKYNVEVEHSFDSAFAKKITSTMDLYRAALSELKGAKTPDSASNAQSGFASQRAETLRELRSELAAIEQHASTAPGGRMTEKEKTDSDKIKADIATILDENAAKEAANAVNLKLTDSVQALKLEQMAAYDTPLVDAIKKVREITSAYNADLVVLNREEGDVNGPMHQSLLNWANLSINIAQATYNQSEYARKSAELEKTLGFQIYSKTLSSIGSTVGTSVFDSLNPKKDNSGQLNQLSSRILQLEQEKQMLQGKQYDGEKLDIDRQIASLHQQEDRLKADQARPPSFLKSLAQDVEKSIIDATIKKAEENLKKTVLEMFLGPAPKDVADRQKIAADIMKASADLFKPATDQFHIDIMTFKDSVDIQRGIAEGTITNATGTDAGQSGWMQALGIGTTGLGGGALVASAVNSNNGQKSIDNLAVNMGSLTASMDGTMQNKGGINGLTAFLKSKNGNVAMQDVGKAYAAYQGIKQGGVGGALQAGASTYSMFSGGAASASGAGPYIAAAVMAYTLLAHHDNKDAMPDKYNTDQWGHFLANYDAATVTANGNQYHPDTAITDITKGKSQGQYIHDQIQGKSDAQLKSMFGSDWQEIKDMFSKWDSRNLHDGKDGNLMIGDSTYQWQKIQQLGTEAFTSISNAANTLNAATAPLVSINAYGAGSATFNPYHTPGYGDLSSLYQSPYNYPYAVQPASATNYGPQTIAPPTTVHTAVVLDGRVVAQSVSNYRSQRIGQGFNADS